MKNLLLLILLLPFSIAMAQNEQASSSGESGRFSLGLRNTNSLFTDDGSPGIGTGGQFRIQFGKHINTEWFADYISTNIQNAGLRKDAHIGWSVLFYPTQHPLQAKTFTPYFIAGHCFDYTRVTNKGMASVSGPNSAERWSSAIQMGLGTHYNITERFDVTLATQYMVHLGTDVKTSVNDAAGYKVLNITETKNGVSLEGHLLVSISMNFRIADLW